VKPHGLSVAAVGTALLPSTDLDHPIRPNIIHDIHTAANPVDLDLVHPGAMAQPEIDPLAVITLVTATAMHLVDLDKVARR
jgi:hypothetical protein